MAAIPCLVKQLGSQCLSASGCRMTPPSDPQLYPRCVVQLYHERQAFLHCGRHTINNLLQAPVYSASDFEQLASLLDAGYFFTSEGDSVESCPSAAFPSFSSPPQTGSSSSAVASLSGPRFPLEQGRLPSDLPCAARGSIIQRSRSHWGILSSVFGTSYSAPLWLGNYDLSLLELILGQHQLHLRFANQVELPKWESEDEVSHKDTETVSTMHCSSTVLDSIGQDFPGAVTLEQLRNPRLEGFVVNVAVPRTGWRRVLPRTVSRHFYAIKKLECEYTSDVGQYGYTVLSPYRSKLVVKLPYTGTGSDSDAAPAATTRDRDCISCRSGTDCRNDKQGDQLGLTGPPQVLSTRGYCWVNLDSKLAVPRVFRSEAALMVYLNRKLGMRYQQLLQGRGQEREQERVRVNDGSASSGNPGKVRLNADPVSNPGVSQISPSEQTPPGTEDLVMDGLSLYAFVAEDGNNFELIHDNYTDAVVVEVLRETSA
ncbi:hypothetical protein CSUI_006456 [Cystoisospora suis]|uniref:ubiquitinyl hydrolase 1 n=1 Tax=Cystoisospora suis TaxID=483139 RepID=A0A2C6KTZ6_9APIC|nr:hypothetical protein CSUI_006456 [Cystoisospora suis]